MRGILWSVVPPRGEYQQPPSAWILVIAISSCVITAAVFVRVRMMHRTAEDPEPPPIPDTEPATISEVPNIEVEPPAEPPPKRRHRIEPVVVLPKPHLRSYRTGEKFISL